MDEEISFGSWLRQQRRALDLSQRVFADQVGCAEVTLRRIEKGTLKPSRELTTVLLDNLGIPKSDQAQWVSFARGISGVPTSSSNQTSKPITNLPAPLTTFVGREKEQSDIMSLSAKHRLVTLTGLGGVGKTRLAMKVGEQTAGSYPNGVWLVELASVMNPILVPLAAANALGLRNDPQRQVIDMLCEHLREKNMLLILDNCEHIIDGCAAFIFALLRQCSHLHVLATSREPLGVTGEALYRVPTLGIPNVEPTPVSLRTVESVQLFEERAQLVQFDFALTLENAMSIAQICQRLDGIPLAIELAAANAGRYSPEKIARQLDESFQLLTTESRTASPRHQTLRASINWSWNLLTKPEQRIMRQLSVFVGGWTLEAAQSVCNGDVLYLLGSLVTKSLIVMQQEKDETVRYSFHETIRQYAHEKLRISGEVDLICQHHLAYFVNLAERGYKQIRGPDQIEWMDRLENEVDNFRAALDWCVSKQHTEDVLRLLKALSLIWSWRGNFSDIESWFDKICVLPDAKKHPALYAGLLNQIGNEQKLKGDIQRALSLLQESQRIWLKLGTEGEHGLAQALGTLGQIALYNDKDIEAAQSFFERSFDLYQKCGDEYGMAWLIYNFGNVAYVQARYADAEEQYRKSLARFQELGDKRKMADLISSLAELMRIQGDYGSARKFWRQNLRLFQELRSRSRLAYSFQGLAWASLRQNDYGEAKTWFEKSITLSIEYRNKGLITNCLAGLAGVLGMTGRLEIAARLFGSVEYLLEGLGRMEPADQKDFDHYVSVVRAQLEESLFEKSWIEGRGMTLEQAIGYALKEGDE